jgi:ankyrin repeat protein
LSNNTNFSSNLLAAFIATSLEPTEIPDCRRLSEYLTQEVVDRLWKSGDIGTALTMQEMVFLNKYNYLKDCNIVSSTELRKYCDMHSEMTKRLKIITHHDVPAVPPLHSFLTRTRGSIKFPTDFTQVPPLEAKDYAGRSLFHVAVDLGVGEYMMNPIKFNAALISEDDFGRGPIHVASSGSSKVVVEYLIGGDARTPHLEDRQGRTALHYASASGNEDISRLLVNRGAMISHETKFHETPLSRATENEHAAVVQLLLKEGADVNQGNPLYKAVKSGSYTMIRLLLENGADINQGDLLCVAVERGDADIVELLLEKGADVNQGNPLYKAVKSGSYTMIRLLLENGADVNRGDLLSAAIYRGYIEIVRLLLEKGADSRRTRRGLTLLEQANMEGHQDIADFLRRMGYHSSEEELE